MGYATLKEKLLITLSTLFAFKAKIRRLTPSTYLTGHADVAFRDTVDGGVGSAELTLDSMSLKVFSNLNNYVVL